MINSDTISTGRHAIGIIMILIASVILSYAIAQGGWIAVGGLLGLPFLFLTLHRLCVSPKFGIILLIYIAFTINCLGRYTDIPVGLLVDFIMVCTLIISIFHLRKDDLSILNNHVVILCAIWFMYNVLELINPEPHSAIAWIFAVRTNSLYMLVTIILAMLLFNTEKDLDKFVNIWLVGSLLGAIYGLKQLYIGMNATELYWVTHEGAKTHMIFGQLRVFSFYSDAGQFGAIMAYTGVVAMILAINIPGRTKRIFCIITSLLCLYGMVISGTRGALAIPFIGFTTYFVLSKNIKVLIIGFTLLCLVFGFLKFTYIGQENYNIRRMRTALTPTEDPSFMVRIKNQRKLKDYMSSRPFGGGLGTIGYWGNKFMPGTFLADTPPDSWYVLIWAETGIIGLTLYLGTLLFIMTKSFLRIFRMQPSPLKQKMMALYSGTLGILVASYGNPILGQMPISIYFYLCLVFLYLGPRWEDKKDLTLAYN